jgi:hypothetical protein
MKRKRKKITFILPEDSKETVLVDVEEDEETIESNEPKDVIAPLHIWPLMTPPLYES